MSEKVAWRLKSQLKEQNLPTQVEKVSDFSQSATADFVLVAAVSTAQKIVKFKLNNSLMKEGIILSILAML